MARIEQHCIEAGRTFGAPFEEVHRWLDEFAGRPPHGMRHRQFRHHEVGILEAERLFAPPAGAVARQHIITDLKEEGWREGDPFPRDREHYRRLGLF